MSGRANYDRMAIALAGCSFPPGSWDKRFARSMAFLAEHSPDKNFTERQRVHLIRLVHKYRRQISASVIELALDEAMIAADCRVAAGLGALADFTPAKRMRMTKGCARSAPPPLLQGQLL